MAEFRKGALWEDGSRSVRSVCFTAFHAYPLFDSSVTACVGGMETRAWQLANGLATFTDWKVHFVVQAPRRFRQRQFGDVTVWNRGDGFDAIRQEVSRKVRLNQGAWPQIEEWNARLLWQLPLLAAVRPFRDPPPPATESDPFYSQIKPDVLCGIGVSAQSASVIMTARALSRPSVLFLASNADLDERYGPTSSYVSPYGERGDVCWSAIQNATVIVTQGEDQQQLLNSRFDREGQVLASPIDLSGWDTAAEQQSPLLDRLALSRFVLWVGRADRFHKRPELCLQLARAVEDIAFLMVLNPSDPDVERTIRETAPPNVTIVESVPYAEMPALMQRADVLVSTGSAEYEGAPNVFLQAAAARIPVASLEVSLPVDSHSGFMADGDLDRLVNYLRECWDHPESAQQQGIDARQEVERLHDLPIVTRQLAELLDQATVPTDG